MELSTLSIPIISIALLIVLLLIIILFFVRAHRRMLNSESRLRASQEQLTIMLKSIDDGIIATDKTGLITLINPAAQHLTGWFENEAINKPLSEVFQVINAKNREPILNPVSTVLKSGRTQGLANHTILLAKNGKEYHITNAGAPILNRRGEVKGAILSFADVTEKHLAEQKRQHAQQQMADLISSLPGVVYSRNMSYKWPMEFINQGIEKLSGYTPEEFYPHGEILFGDLIHPDDRDDLFKRISDAVAYNAPFTINYRLVDKYKREHWVLETGLVTINEETKKIFIDGFIIDISQIRWDSKTLRQTQFHFQKLADTLPLGLFETDEKGQITYINEYGLNTLGHTPQRIKEGLSLLDFFVLSDRKRATAVMKDALDCVPTTEANYQMIRDDGSAMQTLLHLLPFTNDDNLDSHTNAEKNKRGLVGYFIDITKLSEAEQAMRDERENLRQLFQNMATGVAIFEYDVKSKNFICVSLNESGEQISQISKEKAVGKPLQVGFPRSIERGILNALQRAHESGEIQYISMIGDEKKPLPFVEFRIFRLPSERLVILFDDRAEQQKLANRVLQMEKMDAIGQLAGGVAHDFNNQIGVILGYADMLQKVIDDPVQRRYLSHILECAHHSSDLTKKLLAFARKGKYQFISIDLHTIISDVAEILSHSIDKKIEIILDLKAAPSTTFGDPAQLQNALLNMAINARDAMPDGGTLNFATQTVELTAPTRFNISGFDLEPGTYLTVSLSDTGSGIPESLFEHIFEPFFTTKETGTGNGMGLAAAYGTLKNHKGAIELISEVNQGTTFTLYLPQVNIETAPRDLDSDTESIDFPARILVIEDEKALRAMLNDLLYSLRTNAIFFDRGKAGIDHYRQHASEIDLIILDMVMPGMNGPETFKVLREINPKAKVLLISGYSVEGDAQKLLNHGAAGFIQKPFERALLIKTINQILSQEKQL